MPTSQAHRRRRTLGLGFLAAAASVALLLALQYVWLTRLQEMTTIAHRAALDTTVRSVGNQVEAFYRSAAERCLSIPSALFADPETEIARYWSNRPREGIRRLFVVDYSAERFGRFLMYEDGQPALVPVLTTEEGLAIVVAVSPLQMLHEGGRPQEKIELTVTERDPDHRIIVRPVLGPEDTVVGAAGMVIDEEWLRAEYLPRVANRALSEHFPGYAAGDVAVTVRDSQGGTVFSLGEAAGDPAEVAPHRASFPFVFRDWTISVTSPTSGPESWARASFLFNMALSVLLALALLGGIWLAMRAANRAMLLSDLKSEFVSNVSHELRTPLASIRTFAELLRLGRASGPEKVRQYGGMIESESRRLTRLVDNILDFSRIESGRKEYRFEPGKLEEVAEGMVESFQRRLSDQGFVFQWVPPEEPLPPVEMDEAAVGQVLYNLIDNAVKYSGESRRIRVAVRRVGSHAVCSVRDWGVGIPMKEQKRIFERFHRVGSGLVHDVKGSGLGLAIVKHVVRAHGGDVSVESTPGEGTRIAIRLPIETEGMPEPSRRRSRDEDWPEARPESRVPAPRAENEEEEHAQAPDRRG